MKKDFKPKTKPTGFEPSDRVVKPPVERAAKQMVTNAALRVKVVYVQERSRWESLRSGETVYYTPAKKYEGVLQSVMADDHSVVVEAGRGSTWQALVDWCEKRGFRPEEYVRLSFEAVPMQDVAPQPDQLMGPKYQKKFEKLYPLLEEKLGVALANQKRVARTALIVRQTVYGEEPDFAQLVVATDSHLDLSPLFRYCFAFSIGTKKMLRVARKFQAEAVLQFECYRRAYKKSWADSLPAGFARMSRELYPFVLAKLGQDMRGFCSDGDEK